jgi:hypothetical protein
MYHVKYVAEWRRMSWWWWFSCWWCRVAGGKEEEAVRAAFQCIVGEKMGR